jgi:hypothetical protein
MLDTGPITPRTHDAQPLTATEWWARVRAHRERAQRWTLPHKKRRSRHEPHPVHDFLFQYYMYSPGKLETWHPAPAESLMDSPEARERFCPPDYRTASGVIEHDLSALSHQAREQLQEVVNVLVATRSRPANFGCYGVHEWAMVYRGRFFAPEAKPLNRIELEWSIRHEVEQPGCIHANMDLYRWAYTVMPWVGSDLLLDCFELAAELRVLDMQASPYDLRGLGFEPVRVETVEGRSEYQRRQKELSERAEVLRSELIQAVRDVLAA